MAQGQLQQASRRMLNMGCNVSVRINQMMQKQQQQMSVALKKQRLIFCPWCWSITGPLVALLHLIFTPNQTDVSTTGWNIASCCGRKKQRPEMGRSHTSNQILHSRARLLRRPHPTTGGRAGSKILLGAQKAES